MQRKLALIQISSSLKRKKTLVLYNLITCIYSSQSQSKFTSLGSPNNTKHLENTYYINSAFNTNISSLNKSNSSAFMTKPNNKKTNNSFNSNSITKYNSNNSNNNTKLPKVGSKEELKILKLEKREKNFSCYFNIPKKRVNNDKNSPKILVNDKVRLNHIHEVMEKIKFQKHKQAKELKESVKIIRENISVLKEKIVDENRQQKNVIKAKEKIIFDSFIEYSKLKKLYVKNSDNNETDKLMKEIKVKQGQLSRLQKLSSVN